jgi:uncharacterized protein
MELRDAVLVDRLVPSRPELKRLMDRHQQLESEISMLVGRRWLSDREQYRLRELKKEKLNGKDQIEAILAPHRQH